MQGLIIFLTLGVGIAYGCDENQITQCISTFTRAVGGADPSVLQTEQQINSACNGAFPNLNNCLKRHTRDCPKAARMMYEGLTDTFEYACSDARDDMIEFSPCLSQTGLRNKIKKCQDTLNDEIREKTDADQDTRCGFVETFLNCVEDAAEDQCGEDAAEFQDKINRRAVAPMIEQIGCDVEAPGSAGRATVGWTVVCALITRLFLAYLAM